MAPLTSSRRKSRCPADAGDRHQSLGGFVLPGSLANILFENANLFEQQGDMIKQELANVADRFAARCRGLAALRQDA